MATDDRTATGPSALPSSWELPTSAPDLGDLIPAHEPQLPVASTSPPTIRADGGVVGDRWIAAASVAGRSPQAQGLPARDSYCYTVADDGSALIVAVCAGLRSRPHSSQIGADLLARFACHQAAAISQAAALSAGPQQLTSAIGEANEQLLAHRATHLPQWQASDLSTTLLVCRLPLDPVGGPILCARVGDGEVLMLSGDNFFPVFPPPRLGGTNSIDATLPAPESSGVVETTTADTAGAVALVAATEGLARDIRDSPTVRGWLAHRWAVPCGAHLMLDTLRYRHHGSLDDRTGLVVWLHRRTTSRNLPTTDSAARRYLLRGTTDESGR